jgi:hypothetical protein
MTKGKELFKLRENLKIETLIQKLTQPPTPSGEETILDNSVILGRINEFLEFTELLKLRQINRNLNINSKLIKYHLINSNIPINIRDNFILFNLLRIHEIINSYTSPSTPTPADILNHFASSPRPAEAVGEIERDVVRTLPSHPRVIENRESLKKLLLAVSAAEPSIGYCQGMNFVGANLLIIFNFDLISTFFSFLSILKNFHFQFLYSPSVPLLPLRMYQFSRLVRDHVPSVWHHLNTNSFSVEIFAHQWVMTLFTYFLPPGENLRTVFELFFLEGWTTVFSVGIEILKILENEIIQMNIEEISNFMNNRNNIQINFRNLIDIANTQLSEIETKFFSEKLLIAISQINSNYFNSFKISYLINRPINSQFFEEEIRDVIGFSVVHIRLENGEQYPTYLKIDLNGMSSGNRPFEMRKIGKDKIQIPLKTVKELKEIIQFISIQSNFEFTNIENELNNLNNSINIKNNFYINLVKNSMNIGNNFDEILKKKQRMSRALREKAEGTVSTRSSSTQTTPVPSSVVPGPTLSDLLVLVTEIEKEYSAIKNQKEEIETMCSNEHKELKRLSSIKRGLIEKLIKVINQAEETRNDIVQRAISSTIISFSL